MITKKEGKTTIYFCGKSSEKNKSEYDSKIKAAKEKQPCVSCGESSKKKIDKGVK